MTNETQVIIIFIPYPHNFKIYYYGGWISSWKDDTRIYIISISILVNYRIHFNICLFEIYPQILSTFVQFTLGKFYAIDKKFLNLKIAADNLFACISNETA